MQESGQTGTVMTLTELLEEGENSPWKGVSHEVLLRALMELQKERKAEVFEENDGVKFF